MSAHPRAQPHRAARWGEESPEPHEQSAGTANPALGNPCQEAQPRGREEHEGLCDSHRAHQGGAGAEAEHALEENTGEGAHPQRLAIGPPAALPCAA